MKLAFTRVAGIGGILALVIAYRRQRLAEHAHRLAEDAEDRANAAAVPEQTKLHNDRFTTAAAQLGHDSPAIHLAGVHALAGLADDAPTTDPTSNLHGRVSFRSATFTGGTVHFRSAMGDRPPGLAVGQVVKLPAAWLPAPEGGGPPGATS